MSSRAKRCSWGVRKVPARIGFGRFAARCASRISWCTCRRGPRNCSRRSRVRSWRSFLSSNRSEQSRGSQDVADKALKEAVGESPRWEGEGSSLFFQHWSRQRKLHGRWEGEGSSRLLLVIARKE